MKLHSVSSGVTELPVHSFKEMHKQRGGRPTEPHQVPVLLLDENGMIKDGSRSVESLFGYRLNEIAWQHVSCLFPQLSEVALLEKGRINPKFDFIARCGHIFQGLDKQGNAIPTELSFICLEHDGLCTMRLVPCPCGSENRNPLSASL